MKICSKCNIEKDKSEFSSSKKNKDNLLYSCKECEKKRYNKYYEKNKEEILKRSKVNKQNAKNRDINKYIENRKKIDKISYLKHREKKLNNAKEYAKNNKQKIYERIKNKRKTNDLYSLSLRVSNLIRINVRKNGFVKNSKTINILGCNYMFFKEYIESQFTNEMNWNNIHLDHIKPMSSAKNEDEIYQLNHYTNFQPLLSKDNILKSDKLITKQLRLL
jgi:hypothetical protein